MLPVWSRRTCCYDVEDGGDSAARLGGVEGRLARLPVHPALRDEQFEERELALVDSLDLHLGLSTLTDSQREALVPVYFEGHTYREVATTLGIPEGIPKNRLRDGIRKLRDLARRGEHWVPRVRGSDDP